MQATDRIQDKAEDISPQPRELYDAHGRKIDYIRLSLTDRCNFRCVYCMPEHGGEQLPHAEILSYEELLRFCGIAASLGISRYKITGGEPLCRKGAVEFIRSLRALPGVSQTSITTNGTLLAPHVDTLAELGVNGINVSLDTLSQDHFGSITRGRIPLAEILPAMEAARRRGIRVKINVVPLKGYNDTDLPELVSFALANNYHIRFIELMPVGRGRVYDGVPQDEIRMMIEDKFGPLSPLGRVIGNGPAECYRVGSLRGSVGFISALSKKFCHSCNRIRLTAAGFLKTCLHHNIGVDLKSRLRDNSVSDKELERIIVDAVNRKPKAHEFSREQRPGEPKTFFMNSVGG